MTEDILCEARGPAGMTCTLPYGHQPPDVHAFDVQLPHDLGDMLEGFMKAAEEARIRYEKAARHQRIMFALWGGMCLFYLILIIMKASA